MSRDKGDIKEDLMSADNKESDGKKKKRIIIAIVSALLIALLSVGFFIYRDQFMAITMRIQRLVGTVNLYNEGHEQELREKMRLGAGQTVETAGESLIMVSLDDTKLMTMEESSKADIKARGKKLEFDLIEGNLFFNVTEKLKKRESFDIHTSTMICGIRGTSAYVGRDSTRHETLMVTDGVVSVDATNPVTKETIHVDVYSGEKITIFLDEEAEGDATISIKKEKFREEDLPSLALDAIRKSPELQKRIVKATGFSTERLVALADATSKSGISMYGSAAEKLSADGIKDAIPIMGYNAQIMVRTANRAVDTAGDDLPLEIAIIKGLNGTMNSGIEAGYEGEPLSALVDSAADCMEACIKGARNAGLGNDDLVTVSDSVTGALQTSVGEMAKANLSTTEITQVVDAIGTVYTEAIASGAVTGTDTEHTAASGSSGQRASIDNILTAVGNASNYITNTVDSEMLKKSTGEETAAELLRKARATESKAEESQTKADKPRQTAGNTDASANSQNTAANAPSATSSVNTQSSASAGTESTGTATSAPPQTTSSSGNSSSSSSSGSGNSGSNSGGNQNGGNSGSAPAVYGDMTIAGGITGGSVSTPLAAGSAPAQGETVTLNLVPNVGHSFNSLTVNTVDDNGNVTGSVNTTEVTAGNQYTFVMPTEKIVVNATFTPNTYNVNLNLNGATVTGGNITQYTYGTAVALPTQVTKASTAEFDYSFTGWTDAPTGGNPVTGITATDINDKNFYPQFSQTRRSYAVTKSTNVSNGSISVKVGTAEVTQAQNSGTVTVTVTPDTGYELASLTYTNAAGNATAITATNGVYSFVMPTEDITVNATFTQIAYNLTATFDSNKGNVRFKVGGNYVTSAHYTDVVVIELTPDTGYVSTRPSVNNGAVMEAYIDANTYRFDMPASDATVTETFDNASYTVSLDTHGGTINSGNVTSYTYGTGVTLPTDVTKAPTATTNYAFAGWFTEATGGTQVTAISTTDTGNKTYHAHWTESAGVYAISKGSVSNGSITVKVGATEVTQAANGAIVTVVATAATGYELNTLTYTSAGGSATAITVTNGVGTFTMPASNVTVNATFTLAAPVSHTLAIANNIAHGSVDYDGMSSTFETGDPVNLYIYPDPGYKIRELYYMTQGSSTRVNISNNTFSMPNANVTVYASFELDQYTISFDMNASNDPQAQIIGTYTSTYTYGSEVILPTNVQRTGYTFDGWYTRAEGGLRSTKVKTTDTGNKTFYAHWTQTPVSYNITVGSVSNGSVTPDRNTAHRGDTVTLTTVANSGYSIVDINVRDESGRSIDLTEITYNSTTRTSTDSFVMPEGNVTVTALFAEYDPSVTYYQVVVNNSITNGRIETDLPAYAAGETVVLTITPSMYYGLESAPTITDASNNSIAVTDVSTASVIKYSFTMPASNVNVNASFGYVVPDNTLTAIYSSAGGSVTLHDYTSGAVITTAVYDQVVEVRITPNPGYSFAGKDSLTISYEARSFLSGEIYTYTMDSSDISGSDTPDSNGVYHYTFEMPVNDASLAVVFESASSQQAAVSIDAATLHGTVTPDKTQASVGEIVTLTATPDSGYTLSNIIVKDASNNVIAVSDHHTFAMPDSAVTVKGVFVPVYAISTRYDSRKIGGIELYESGSGRPVSGSAKAGDSIILTVETPSDPSLSFDGIRITDASGSSVSAQFIERTERTSISITGPSITYVYYTYSFTMPASAITVQANASVRNITISNVAICYHDGTQLTPDTNGTYGSASLDRMSGEPGDTLTLTVSPADGYYCYMWSLVNDNNQSDSTYGYVTSGETGIGLSSSYGYSQTLYVCFADVPTDQYDVTVPSAYASSVWIDKDEAEAGETVTVSISSPEGTYCSIIELYDENDDLISTVSDDSIISGTASFSMPGCDVVVKPTFADMVSITRSYNRRAGSVAINGDSNSNTIYALPGDRISVSVSPNSGYSVTSARIEYTTRTWDPSAGKSGAWVYESASATISLTNGSGSFTMPETDTVVAIAFESTSQTTYQISIDGSITNGTVTSDATGNVSQAGRYVTISADPDSGYRLVSFAVSDSSGTSIETDESETSTGMDFGFYMPDEDVTVTATFERYYMIAYDGDVENVYITEQPTSGIVGQRVVISINEYKTIDNGNYYRLDSVEYSYINNGSSVTDELQKDANGNYSFIMPASDVTVRVHTDGITYYDVGVSKESGEGTWTASAPKVASSMGSIDYTIRPATGYVLDKVEYGNIKYVLTTGQQETPTKYTGSTTRNQDGTYSFTFNMSGAYYYYWGGSSFYNKRPHVWIYFSRESYAVSAPGSITGGTVSAGSSTAEYGSTVTLTVTPDTDYTLKSLTVATTSGSNVPVSYGASGYTFTMPASAVTVSAEFVATSSVSQPATDSSPSEWFTSNDVVRLSSNVDTSDAITVGSGKTLIIDPEVTVDARGGVTIANGGVVNNYGTFNTYNNMTNNGTFNNYSAHTLNNYGTIINNGEIVNGDGEGHDGRINNHDDAVIENNGTIINNEGSVINNDGEIEGNEIEGDGDVNGVENAGTDSSAGPDPDEDGMPQSDPAVLPESTSESAGSSPDEEQSNEESSEEESETEEESSEEESSGEED